MRKRLWSIVVVSVLMVFVAGYAFAKGEDRNKKTDKGNVVSQAAHEAQEEGLKGKDLAGKVHEAVEERKEGKEKEMEEKKESVEEEKAETKKGEHHKHGKGKGKHSKADR